MKRIKNVKVSYPKEYNDKLWAELYAKRDKLLRMSDFALLPDNGLTDECLKKWKVWRKSLKLLTKEKFKTIPKATEMLNNIRSIMPPKEYKEENMDSEEQEILNQIEIDKMKESIATIEKDLSSLASALLKIKEKQKPKTPDTVEGYRELLMKLSKQWYMKSFEEALEAPMPVIIERCEQAIEYKVGADIATLPLIRNYMKLSNKSAMEIADKFINDKKELMSTISTLDRKMWNFKLKIEHCDDFQELKNIHKQLTLD